MRSEGAEGMSIGTTDRPEVEEPRSRLAALAARPHVRQTTAEITARICEALPIAAITTAATGLATGVLILARRHRRR
jgi:hypothetical protein